MHAQKIYERLKNGIRLLAGSGDRKVTGSVGLLREMFHTEWSQIMAIATSLGHSEEEMARHLFFTAATSLRNELGIAFPPNVMVTFEGGDQDTINLGEHDRLMSALG